MIDRVTLEALLLEHAPPRPVALAPELIAWHAEDELPLWEALEREAGEPLPPPYFAVAWPGSQAIARFLLDGGIAVRGVPALDLGCGSGIAAIAAAKLSADARAIDVDPLALAACGLLAERNGVRVTLERRDGLADPPLDVRVVLAGDLVYHRGQREGARRAVAAWRSRGIAVLLADAGRPHFDPMGLPLAAEYLVPVPRAVEGIAERRVRLYLSA